MEDKRKVFQNVLKKIDFPLLEGILSGEVSEVVFDRSDCTMRIKITFTEFVAPDTLYDLMKSLKEKLVEMKYASKVLVDYHFAVTEIPQHTLEIFYKYFVNELSNKQVRYRSLGNFETTYNDNTVKLMVANDFDKSVVDALLPTVKDCFKKFGLEIVDVISEINNFIVPLEDEIETSHKIAEVQINREQMLYDNAKSAVSTPEKQKVTKMKRQAAPLSGVAMPIKDVPSAEYELVEYVQKNSKNNFLIEGDVIKAEIRELSTGSKIYEATVFDGESSIVVKTFLNSAQAKQQEEFYNKNCMSGKRIRCYGYLKYDQYSRDMVLMVKEIGGVGDVKKPQHLDTIEEKRVELHAHTKMSAQDSILAVDEYVARAKEYGHKALAVTDKYNVQGLPELAKECKKAGIKPIFGMEGALVDEDGFKIALTDEDIDLDEATFVVYDLETTGISSNYNEIIEIAACKIYQGNIIDEFTTFVNPRRKISEFTTNLTSITDDDVRNAPFIETAIMDFYKFIEGSILVAHNATFDNSHLYRNLSDQGITDVSFPTIDTLQLARVCYGDKLKRFNLKAVSKYFDVELEQHHRAISDAKTTAYVFLKMLSDLREKHINNYNEINNVIVDSEAYKYAYPTHVTLLAKTREGLVNINRIVTESYTVNFSKEPRVLKKFLESHKEGILIGSCCYNGVVFTNAMNKSYSDLIESMKFYDFIEVQSPDAYSHLIESSGGEITKEHIQAIIKKIIKAADELGKIVVATGDVHHLDPEDKKYRQMLFEVPMVGGGMHDFSELKDIPSTHFRSTSEMLGDFEFLGYDKSYEIVITNTNKINDMIEEFPLFPDKLFAPGDDFMAMEGIPSAKDELLRLTYATAHSKYGENIPRLVQDRLDKELNSIIKNDYATIYFIAYMLVKHSKDAGYVVGSRGSVGSSLVANFMGITEVNSLPPHYVCPHCHFTAFKLSPEEKRKYGQTEDELKFEDILQKYGTGFDMPKAKCPVCGEEMLSDGCDIPFETFLGFSGNKTPDIDLNFSGEYQERAHNYCRDIFGKEYSFRAGTISGIAENTAYGYVKGHYERLKQNVRSCELDREGQKLLNVKRTTGQHPGGIVVLPKGLDVNEITPVQYPADNIENDWMTTHQTYHNFENNLLKLDILGHDDPTMIRHLMNYVERYPEEFPFSKVEDIPLDDKNVLKMFSGVDVLGVKKEDILEEIATTGLPEFGTGLTKDMLKEIHPTRVSDLIKISGLSHGTGIWAGNMRDLFLGLKPGVNNLDFNDLIGCRDDIMAYLISMDLPALDAFTIMEGVRKGKGVKPDQERLMLDHDVPKWYIEACNSIQYMFPKAHATAYVIMALRIGWFKLYRPIYYYAGFFSERAKAYEIETMVGGYEAIKSRLIELQSLKKMTNKESDIYSTLLLSLEMCSRGFTFKQIDIEKSDWKDFVIDGNSLIIPFGAMDSLGPSIAKSIVDARNEYPFTSIKDVSRRSRLNNTLLEKFIRMGVFKDLPNDDQIGLFANMNK